MTNQKNSIDIDSVDIIFAVALWGGFETGNWLPVILLIGAIAIHNHEKSKL